MTKEEAEKEYLKLLKKHVDDNNKIIEKAKKEGIWKSGLDSNNEFFTQSKEEFMKKVELLKTMVDEQVMVESSRNKSNQDCGANSGCNNGNQCSNR